MQIKENPNQEDGKMEISKSFWMVLENGVYQELYKKKLLSEEQFNTLLQKNGK